MKATPTLRPTPMARRPRSYLFALTRQPASCRRRPSSLLEAIIMAARIRRSIRQGRASRTPAPGHGADAENERLFNEALAAAQAEMVPIVADAVNTEVGRAHRYASYAQLDRAVRPIYSRTGSR